jgi:hypothetical protein
MEKNTKILIGAGALALAYYLYNASKAAKANTSISATPTPSILKLPPQAAPPVMAVPEVTTPDIVSPIQAEAALAVKQEIDRLAKVKAQQDENALQQAIIDAQNTKAYLKAQADIKARNDENVAAAKAITDAAAKAKAEAEARAAADEAARQKAMNAFMYPTCPDGFEFYQNNCMPTYLIVEEKAKKGEGLVLRDFKSNTTTLVQTCPAEYVKQGINCIPRYSLSPQQLQVLTMEEAGMVQTSDGQWYTSAEAAAIAQAKIDTYNSNQNSTQKYTPRQNNINIAICSIDRDGYINNFNSPTNGMSLSKYIGEFKVKSAELSIARASCPNSVYSSNLIAGGRTDDNALGYKGI